MINSFDWFEDVEERFNNHPRLSTLKQERFYGSITINFEAGIPKTVNFNQHIKADMQKP